MTYDYQLASLEKKIDTSNLLLFIIGLILLVIPVFIVSIIDLNHLEKDVREIKIMLEQNQKGAKP